MEVNDLPQELSRVIQVCLYAEVGSGVLEKTIPTILEGWNWTQLQQQGENWVNNIQKRKDVICLEEQTIVASVLVGATIS